MRTLFEYGPAEYWPNFTFTAEESETLNTLRTDIGKYCDAMEIDFITGTKSLSDWNSYLSQLDKLKVDDMLSIYQAAIDRYHALDAAN